MSKMFCFQCEQTASCTGCTGGAGVCGKFASVACLQDELTGALIALAQSAGAAKADETRALVVKALFATVTNVDFSEDSIRGLIGQVHDAKDALGASAPDYDMKKVWEADEDIRSLKSLVLFGIRGMAAYEISALVEYAGLSLEAAARRVVQEKLPPPLWHNKYIPATTTAMIT